MIQAKEFTLPFIKHEAIAKDTYAFYFDRTKSDLEFLSGMYLRMILDVPEPDERGSSRNFSIASSPLEKSYIRIVTKVIPFGADASPLVQTRDKQGKQSSSFKQHLLTLTQGQEIKFFGPMGRFILKEEEKKLVFLAGGIGITPFLSMIPYIHEKQLNLEVTLLVSFSNPEELIFYDQLVKIGQENPHIKIVYTLTHPEESSRPWQGETGRITDALIKKYVPGFATAFYYIVGPPKMVLGVEVIVREMQIPQEKILKENFVGY